MSRATVWDDLNERLADSLGRPFTYQGHSTVSLHFDMRSIQSKMSLNDPDRLMLGYTRTMMASLLFKPAPEQIVLIGLGGGSLVKYCRRHLPMAQIVVAEINPHIIALRDAFQIPADDEQQQIHCCDGAAFVRARAAVPDLLLLDGFDAEGQAPSLCTQDFYDDCYSTLADDGVMVLNLYGADPLYRLYIDRVQQRFGDQVVVIRSEDCLNKIVFAGKGSGLRCTDAQLLFNARQLGQQHPLRLSYFAKQLILSRRESYLLAR
ncbi:spermidine synthase [Andreprevotia lacus DSM 23236]|jgi:spermidine synthase|uniref:Spermidine synthase n=1 Tax=Andreprevotia lacus DSM 23236 TaxID=1121001 RepID=A0A1W1X2Z6_9NEIS|nr:hypothetical protein [Andreprevotia lacus]SMC18277.1 spermidine synthase [Andreprevotia lacus DSM 23236]